MTRLLLTLALTSFLFATAHADEASDYANANMTWADNDDFHRANSDQAHYASNLQTDHDYINANMLWSDDREFQAH